jgi:hypothetical protein
MLTVERSVQQRLTQNVLPLTSLQSGSVKAFCGRDCPRGHGVLQLVDVSFAFCETVHPHWPSLTTYEHASGSTFGMTANTNSEGLDQLLVHFFGQYAQRKPLLGQVVNAIHSVVSPPPVASAQPVPGF